MRASTLARVAGATSARPLRTLETVGTETPAACAIFEIVIGVDSMLLTFGGVFGRGLRGFYACGWSAVRQLTECFGLYLGS